MQNISTVFYFCSVLFIINQVLQWLGIKIFFLYAYLDDLLCFPIVLSLLLLGNRVIKKQAVVLGKIDIIISFLVITILFEFILPNLSNRFTKDYFDIIFYILGVIVFQKYINKETEEK